MFSFFATLFPFFALVLDLEEGAWRKLGALYPFDDNEREAAESHNYTKHHQEYSLETQSINNTVSIIIRKKI